MRSPRRIDPALLAALPGDVTPPPPDALFWTMWEASREMATAAFETDYVQGIGHGNLDPTLYGAFSVNDAYYCFHGADDYRAAADRACDPGLKAYLLAKATSYDSYNQSFTTTWHLKDGSNVVPLEVTAEYSEFETAMASGPADPIYALIVMIPCEYLWSYLANQLVPQSPQGNLYYPDWIEPNLDESGAFKMGNFLYDYMQQNPGAVDPGVATDYYQTAMTFEAKNFAAATAPPSQ